MDVAPRNALLETWTQTSAYVFSSVVEVNRAAFDAFRTPEQSDEPAPGENAIPIEDGTEPASTVGERELARRTQNLSLLAAALSHDLRNPLRSAQSHLEMAQHEQDSELLEEVETAHERMDALIEDMLVLAQQGDVVSDVEPVELADAASDAWAQIDAPGATLDTDALTVPADRTRLLQLLENLFDNAVTHGPDDVTVRVGPTETGFYVEDDGPGIPAAERERVFEYGYTTAESGTGFGLRIVAAIADAHGWTLHLSESGGVPASDASRDSTDSQCTSGGARFTFEV
ncbi:sensor histidine kinase [Halorientalis salina]|uniref:sensor histidine kinase n=1 Tax=Halorientalis salina TaxID=2932266 RepID=UPI0010AD8780|nr:HAMP domain-containing sensor histidine kinase [Halorientalis salina]